MDCTKVQEQMLNEMNASSASPEQAAHLAGCADCAKLWQALQVSSAALDAWTAPEPSPYFDTRFQARLTEVKREEAAAPKGLFAWLRKPVSAFQSNVRIAAMVTALALAVGVGIYQYPSDSNTPGNAAQVSPAVNDLQKLDKNQDLYADFEMLDDLQTDTSQPAANTNSGSKSEL
jgi:hypothetical protein